MGEGGQCDFAGTTRSEVGGNRDDENDLEDSLRADQPAQRHRLGGGLDGCVGSDLVVDRSGGGYHLGGHCLGGHCLGGCGGKWPLPVTDPSQGGDGDGEGHGVDPERGGGAEEGDDDPADPGADEGGELGAPEAKGIAGLELVVGQEGGNDRERGGQEHAFPGTEATGISSSARAGPAAARWGLRTFGPTEIAGHPG